MKLWRIFTVAATPVRLDTGFGRRRVGGGGHSVVSIYYLQASLNALCKRPRKNHVTPAARRLGRTPCWTFCSQGGGDGRKDGDNDTAQDKRFGACLVQVRNYQSLINRDREGEAGGG